MGTFLGTFFQVLFSRFFFFKVFFSGTFLQVLFSREFSPGTFIGTSPRFKNSEVCDPGQ